MNQPDTILEVSIRGESCQYRAYDFYAHWPITMNFGPAEYRAICGLTMESNYMEPFILSDGSSEPAGPRCPTCGEVPGWRKRVARSIEEAEAYGWLIPVSGIREVEQSDV